MNTRVETPSEPDRRNRAIVAAGVAAAILALSAVAWLVLTPGDSGRRQEVTVAGSAHVSDASASTANATEALPQLVVHSTATIDGLTSESWVDPASGTRRIVFRDAQGTALNENGWDAASGEYWAVDHGKRVVLHKTAPPPVTGVAAGLEAQYPAV